MKAAGYIVVWDDEMGVCCPMQWDDECEGALCCYGLSMLAFFLTRAEARKAIDISAKFAAIPRRSKVPCGSGDRGPIGGDSSGNRLRAKRQEAEGASHRASRQRDHRQPLGHPRGNTQVRTPSEEMKRFIQRILYFFLRPLVSGMLKMYLWLWDDEARSSPRSYDHQKLIWELRQIQKKLNK